MTIQQILSQPFTWGLLVGLGLTILALWQNLRVKAEFRRYKRHLSDKLEIEAESLKRIRQEQEVLRKENENLRVKVASLSEIPDRKVQRELEVYARAERKMLISVPGFAPAWETAKGAVISELEEEESGRSLPKRMFSRFFGGSRKDEGTDKPLLGGPESGATTGSNSAGTNSSIPLQDRATS